MAEPWMPPDDVVSTCALCGQQRTGVESMVHHLVTVHDAEPPERWPDGSLVIDTSAITDDVAEQWREGDRG